MLEVLLPNPTTTYSRTLGLASASQNGVTLPILQSWAAQRSDILRFSHAPPPPMEKEAHNILNVNIKMRPTDNAKLNQDADASAAEGSSSSGRNERHSPKIVIPPKEKFLAGFRGFDAAVGLPESPTESVWSGTDSFPVSPTFKRTRTQSLSSGVHGGLPRSISEPQLVPTTAAHPPSEDTSYVADGFRHGPVPVAQGPPSYDTIYGPLGQTSVTSSETQLPTKILHTVPSISLFNNASSPPTTPVTTPSGPLVNVRFPEQSTNPRRIQLPAARAPSTPGLTHTDREMLRIRIRSNFAQFFKTMQFTCNDTEKCLVYGYSDASSMKVPWNIPTERTLRQLWKQVMEYDAACEKVKPESQGKRELATYHAVAMGLISSDMSSERLCRIWDRSLAFSTPARRETVQGWLSFTEFVALLWMVGTAASDPSF